MLPGKTHSRLTNPQRLRKYDALTTYFWSLK